MTRRSVLLAGAALLLFCLAGALFLKRTPTAGSSTLSASAQGWLAARTYLERRGTAVALLDRPFDSKLSPDAPLVLTFPWQLSPASEELGELRRWLVAGGTVVFAYTGSVADRSEDLVASELGLKPARIRDRPPLSPRKWWAYANAEWRLKPEAAFAPPGIAREVLIQAPDWIVRAPESAEVLFRGEAREPAIYAFARGRGRVVVLPADALSNGRLENPGNADLLESLRAALPASLVFDEYHHGLASPQLSTDSGSRPSLDLLLLELVGLYLLCAWRLGRRFGPAWQDPPEIASSTSAFLIGLAGLHRKLHHAAPAAVRILDCAESYDSRISVPASLRRDAFDAGEDRFLEIARAVARLQRRGRFD